MFQRDLLTRELEACGENVSKMAERLGLARSHVYKLMSQFGILRTNRGNTP
jgi:transcriptional regulator of acetoin/glycerol metabolism